MTPYDDEKIGVPEPEASLDREMTAILRSVASLEDVSPPADLTDRIMGRIRAVKRQEAEEVRKDTIQNTLQNTIRPLSLKRWMPVAAVAAAVLLAILTIPMPSFGPSLNPSNSGENALTAGNPPDNPSGAGPEIAHVGIPPEIPLPENGLSQAPQPRPQPPSANGGSSASAISPQMQAYFEEWDADLVGTIETENARMRTSTMENLLASADVAETTDAANTRHAASDGKANYMSSVEYDPLSSLVGF